MNVVLRICVLIITHTQFYFFCLHFSSGTFIIFYFKALVTLSHITKSLNKSEDNCQNRMWHFLVQKVIIIQSLWLLWNTCLQIFDRHLSLFLFFLTCITLVTLVPLWFSVNAFKCYHLFMNSRSQCETLMHQILSLWYTEGNFKAWQP